MQVPLNENGTVLYNSSLRATLQPQTKSISTTYLKTINTAKGLNVLLTSSDIVLIFIYCIIFLFGIIGNALVIHYFAIRRKKKLQYHYYLIHLAIADLMLSTATPVHFVYVKLSPYWHLGSSLCTILSVIGPLTVNVSAWVLTSIAHERYRGIVSPLEPRFSKLRIHITVALIWMFSIFLFLPYMLSMELNKGRCQQKWQDAQFELIVAVGTLILQSVLPIVYMIYAVSKMLIVLKSRAKLRKLHSHNGSVLLESVNSEKEKKNKNAGTKHSREKLIKESTANLTDLMGRPSVQDKKPSIVLSRCATPENTDSFEINIQQDETDTTGKDEMIDRNKKEKTIFIYFKKHKEELPLIDRVKQFEDKSILPCSPTKKVSLSAISNDDKYRYRRFRKSFTRFFSSDRQKSDVKQKDIILILVVTYSVFVICSLPYNIFYVIAIVLWEFIKISNARILIDLNFWLSLLVLASSVTNCCVYGGMDKCFRSYCLNLARCRKSKRAPEGSLLLISRRYREESSLRSTRTGSL